jgi:hypothetical protein
LWPGLSAIGDRSPNNSLHCHRIGAAIPQCKIIHCVRHPLDVIVSRLYHEWNLFREGKAGLATIPSRALRRLDRRLRENEGSLCLEGSDVALVELLLDEWLGCNQQAISFGAKHPGRFLLLRYEDLLQDTERAIDGLFEFLLGQSVPQHEKEIILALSCCL